MGIHDQLHDKDLTQRAYPLFSQSLLYVAAHRLLLYCDITYMCANVQF